MKCFPLVAATAFVAWMHATSTAHADARNELDDALAKAEAEYRAARTACAPKVPGADGAKDGGARTACMERAAAARASAREDARVQEKCSTFSGSARAFCVSEEKVRPSNR